MKTIITSLALFALLGGAAMANEKLDSAKSTQVEGLHHGKRHRAINPTEATVTIFGGTFIMRRMTCDYAGSGAARIDTCAPDGMAGGGSKSGERNHKRK